MTAAEREQCRRDIAQAFEFVRFLIRNPQALRKVRNGAEIRILPSDSARAMRARKLPKRVQVFSARTVFRSL